MSTGIAVLNFGEPSEPDRDAVVDYLERIFLANMEIEGETTPEAARERAHSLAERRVPALIEEYEAIGGSPLNAHAETQAERLESELVARGHDVTTYNGFQFTEPFVEDAATAAAEDGVSNVIGLPLYPLCGPSTTVQALEDLSAAVDDLDWSPEYHEITGWHTHSAYLRLRADAIRDTLEQNGLELGADTRLVFSAHGTPQYYLEEGSRYAQYVDEYAEIVNRMLGDPGYELGYQNHENRDVEWTEPDVESVVENLDAERVVVDPVSFMHEQSETLSELDLELREEAEERGLGFFRVPVPYDDDRFIELLADLVEPFVADFDPEYYGFQSCTCRDSPNAMCLNARRNEPARNE
ncbi:ferrochelatase [Haloterrigena sp. SYSU A121-1]|uniref:Ferrochelatase n=1 Tax=Haloterrigena gelatinilytica TaxID=2741724 RepID=A0A8J8KDN5_9EURY|nr:ferrochelatase [Haloterrigena gelatinilytica]NUB93715.1 ferrochelatase [Haloterrigena gelatinilytica]